MNEFEPKISDLEKLHSEYEVTWKEILEDEKAKYQIMIARLIVSMAEQLGIDESRLTSEKSQELENNLRILSEKVAQLQVI